MPSIETSIELKEGEQVIVRTVTFYYTGKVVGTSDKWLALTDAAWIANTGRWSEALSKGKLDEVEPYPDGDVVLIGLGAIIDIAPWKHALPRVVK